MAALLTDGYSTIVTVPIGIMNVQLKEKEVTPADLELGSIDTTTMRNGTYRTKRPKSLISIGNVELVCQYDPRAYALIATQMALGKTSPGSITVQFPDGTTMVTYGWLDKFKPHALKEGEFPLADVTLVCGQQNTSSAEQAVTFPAS